MAQQLVFADKRKETGITICPSETMTKPEPSTDPDRQAQNKGKRKKKKKGRGSAKEAAAEETTDIQMGEESPEEKKEKLEILKPRWSEANKGVHAKGRRVDDVVVTHR